MSQRATFLAVCQSLLGVPYHWGGKSARGLDCSGLVTLALHCAGGPDWRQTHWADRMWRELPAVASPQAGDLALYGTAARATHVMVLLADGQVLGASGGDSQTTRDNAKAGQCVRLRSGVEYRRDFLGFRRLPFND